MPERTYLWNKGAGRSSSQQVQQAAGRKPTMSRTAMRAGGHPEASSMPPQRTAHHATTPSIGQPEKVLLARTTRNHPIASPIYKQNPQSGKERGSCVFIDETWMTPSHMVLK